MCVCRGGGLGGGGADCTVQNKMNQISDKVRK